MTEAFAIGDEHVLIFDVPGEARGKARPRVTQGGQHTYTPDPGGFVRRVSEFATEARTKVGFVETVEPVSLKVHITRAMPKGWSERKRERMEDEFAPMTPDVVNVAAAVCDALEHILYRNDKQVVSLSAYHIWGDQHSVQIHLRVPPSI